MPTPLIALDWGTTRARAFLIGEDGAVLAKRIADRGILRPGMKADITIFNPATVRDVSTYVDPTHYSQGIEHVLVNGKAVVSAGKITAERPGQPIRGRGYQQQAGPAAP